MEDYGFLTLSTSPFQQVESFEVSEVCAVSCVTVQPRGRDCAHIRHPYFFFDEWQICGGCIKESARRPRKTTVVLVVILLSAELEVHSENRIS